MKYKYVRSVDPDRLFSYDPRAASDRLRSAQDHVESCNLKLSQAQEKLSDKSMGDATPEELRKLQSEVTIAQIRCDIAEIKLERVQAMNEFDRRLQDLLDRIKSIKKE